VLFKDKIISLMKENNWKEFADAVRRISQVDYNNFMLELGDLKAKRNLKEFFIKIIFFSEINKSAGILNNLEEYIPDESMIKLLTNKIEIDEKVQEKYSKIFGDKGIKEIYPNEDDMMILQGHEVANALSNISFEKATSWDYIPGQAFKELYNIKKTCASKFQAICKNIAELLTDLLSRDKLISEEIFLHDCYALINALMRMEN
jgi:hypothetical protein